jgi:poly-gamma-glutamate synthesis protein (capsule biosynthesis protein)
VTFTLVAAGDVLPHAPVVASATTGAGIDFMPLMAAVAPFIQGADLALCHMEVPVAPPGTAPSGYPMFAAPAELVPSLAAAGWDGCSTASNHSVDRKAAGLATTLEDLAAAGLGATGTARSEEEASNTQMYVVKGIARDIKVANISFTYGLNGLPKPAGQPWAVNTFDADGADAAPIIEAAQRARDQGADVVIASVHCCVEYQTAPTAAQRSIAEQIAASGLVDLYIGHHAHVPQPIEKLAGGPHGDGMWVAFGLGNFLSNQDSRCCAVETPSGVLLTATFSVDADDRVDVGVEWTAITVDTLSRHTMHVLSDIPGGSGGLSAAEVSIRHARVADAVGTQAPERLAPVAPLAFGVSVVPRV